MRVWVCLGVCGLLLGCGQAVGTSTRSVSGPMDARMVTTQQWQETIATGTGNQAEFALSIKRQSDSKARPTGNLRVRYLDETGYFLEHSAISAWVKLTTTRGEQVLEALPLTTNRVGLKRQAVMPFEGEVDLTFKDSVEMPTAVAFAFRATDAYGHQRWDSNQGNNYSVRLPR